MLAELSRNEADAFVFMLNRALERHLPAGTQTVPVRLPPVHSYSQLDRTLGLWGLSAADAVLLRDSGRPVRVATVAHLENRESWPPRGVLAAGDGTWVLETDGRVTRLY